MPEARPRLALHKPAWTSEEQRRWVALLAASVEVLCLRDGLPVPKWTQQREYRLADPWYLYEGTGRMREWLRQSTPAQFAKRNIWSGDRLLSRV